MIAIVRDALRFNHILRANRKKSLPKELGLVKDRVPQAGTTDVLFAMGLTPLCEEGEGLVVGVQWDEALYDEEYDEEYFQIRRVFFSEKEARRLKRAGIYRKEEEWADSRWYVYAG